MTVKSSLVARRFVLVAVIIPAMITLAGIVVQLVALPYVPSTVATHWNASGEPDGFAPAWSVPLATLLLGMGVPTLLALLAAPGLRRGDRGVTYRFLGATGTWVSALIVVLFTWTFVIQAGGESSAEGAGIYFAFVVALVVASALALMAWFLQPATATVRSLSRAPQDLALASGERVVWVHGAVMKPAVMWVLWGLSIALTGAGIIAIAADSGASGWILAATGLLLVIVVGATTAFRVVVNDAGLTVRSVWGVPRFSVPLTDVAGVEVADVMPMGEFGGWGVRMAPGRFGVVLRAGQAIEVTRNDGRRFVVTTDDAETGAALLAALAERATKASS
ncbi:DUF1648 domain-containing protein [Microbacterium sp. NPDC076911]|uniref:DUF1648 domain-containing protein n=1 Tax=Microbacterium sp. NPDC076911 TaxID=3154958 RepID=UPI00343B7ED2